MLKETIDKHFANELDDIARLVAIPSVSRGVPEDGMPLGREVHNALTCALDMAKGLGFDNARSLDGYCGVVDYGEGEEQLLIMTHLDVVPAGAGWTGDPFTLRRENGRLIGRGVLKK